MSGPRTLHAVAPPARGRPGTAAGEMLLRLIGAEAGPDDRTLVVGTSGDRRTAIRLGAPAPLLVSPRRAFGGRIIARAALDVGAGRLMLWSPELLGAAPAARRGGLAVEATMLDGPLAGADGSIRPCRPARALDRLIAGDEQTGEAWRAAGAPGVEVASLPGVFPAPTREQARARLGLRDEFVLAPLSADPRGVDARALMFVSGVLEILGHPHALVLPECCERIVSALRFRARTALCTPLLLVEPPYLDVLPAADVFLRPASGAAGGVARRLEAIAERLGVPVAATSGWTTVPALGQGSVPADIRENVGAVLTLMKQRPEPVEAA